MAAKSGIETAADLAYPKGSNIDIDIDFDPQGKIDKVKVDGELVPLEEKADDKTQSGGADAGQDGGSSDPEIDEDGIFDSVDRLIDASVETWNNFLDYVPYVVLALGVFVLFIFVASATKNGSRKLMNRSGLRHSLSEVLSRFIYVVVWLGGALLIAKILFPGFEFGTALTYLGVASLILGFAFRDIFENAFAGLLILWRFPFEIGDYIEVETEPPVCGRVHDIWVRSTLIREVTDELVMVPNAKIYQNAVRVTTWRANSRQTFGTLVSYDTDLDHARKTIYSALEACERVQKTPEPLVYIRGFADSGVEFEAAWWAPSGPLEELQSRDQVALAIRKALLKEGIEIPFPYRTLTFKQEHPLHTAAGVQKLSEPETEAEPGTEPKPDKDMPKPQNNA